jgi:hypothetical protein
MARKHEAAQSLRQGNSPAQIARLMGVSVDTVMGYLYNQVGEGRIRRSDILFSIRNDTRQVVAAVETKYGATEVARWDVWKFRRVIRDEHPKVDTDEACFYRDLRKPEVYVGDMFWYLYMIEAFLHGYVKGVLQHEYGATGDDWWYVGIPENIRCSCTETRERDPDRIDDSYAYTTLMNLKEIIDRRWNLFCRYFPKDLSSKKAWFLAGLTRMNQIRNRVMHAAKGVPPTEDDFRELQDFLKNAEIVNWRSTPAEPPTPKITRPLSTNMDSAPRE